jgi:hypothetical protein
LAKAEARHRFYIVTESAVARWLPAHSKIFTAAALAAPPANLLKTSCLAGALEN